MVIASRTPATREVAGEPALELSPAALRGRFAGDFEPQRWIYWVDAFGSAALGWTAFILSGSLSGAASALALAVATFALYRAVLFIHEVAHLRAGAVPGFEIAWNLLIGIPLGAPSVMYVGSHADHHKRSRYGTSEDPEYEAIAQWSPVRIVASTLTMVLLPAALAVRWGVLGPLSRLIPPMRRFVVQSLSTLVINPAYKRQAARGRAARRWLACEVGGAVYFWAAVFAVASGRLSPAWVGRWYVVGCGILVVNHLRTLAAHRYEACGDGLDVVGQLADSVNLGRSPLTALVAPVGLRYHGLHHLLPAVPYHRLGRIHRQLLAELPPDSPYRATQRATVVGALGDLLGRARRHGHAFASVPVETVLAAASPCGDDSLPAQVRSRAPLPDPHHSAPLDPR